MEESWRRKWKVVRKCNVIVWKGILFPFFCLLAPLDSVSDPLGLCLTKKLSSVNCFFCVLTACVFVTRATVRHSRRYVFGKFVRKPNFSWSEAFVNRGLTVYTGCPSRNLPDFGRVFLMLKYTDITRNTYIQSWTFTETIAREKRGLLAVPRTAPLQLTRYVYTAHVLETGMQSTLCLRAHLKCLEP